MHWTWKQNVDLEFEDTNRDVNQSGSVNLYLMGRGWQWWCSFLVVTFKIYQYLKSFQDIALKVGTHIFKIVDDVLYVKSTCHKKRVVNCTIEKGKISIFPCLSFTTYNIFQSFLNCFKHCIFWLSCSLPSLLLLWTKFFLIFTIGNQFCIMPRNAWIQRENLPRVIELGMGQWL